MSKDKILDIEKYKLTEDEKNQIWDKGSTFDTDEADHIANAQFSKLAWGLKEWLESVSISRAGVELKQALEAAKIPQPD